MVLQAAGKPLARSLVPVRERARGKRDRLQRAGLRRTGSLGWSARKALVLHPTVLPHAAGASGGTARTGASCRDAGGFRSDCAKFPAIIACRRCYAGRDDRMKLRRGTQAGRTTMKLMALAGLAGAAVLMSGG